MLYIFSGAPNILQHNNRHNIEAQLQFDIISGSVFKRQEGVSLNTMCPPGDHIQLCTIKLCVHNDHELLTASEQF